MKEIELEMKNINAKKAPNMIELQKYVRYLINVLKYDDDSVYEDVSHWNKTEVAKAITEVERENSKPRPKRYYVSLKEPMGEDR